MAEYPFFSAHELRCRCGCGAGIAQMDPTFMGRLVQLRTDLGFALPVTSAYRCPAYNARVSKTGSTGPHTTGRAVDIRVYGRQARQLLDTLGWYGFTGVGVKQHGTFDSRFIHLDDLPEAAGQPRPWTWSYP